MRVLFAVLLLGEAALTAVWLAGVIPVLGVYGWSVLGVTTLRAGVAALQSAAGFMWIRRLPPAAMFTQWSLLASALLLTLELGAGWLPTSVFPAFRWPVVAGYWAYAIGVSAMARHATR